MQSPFGITTGLGQMGSGALQGLVAANHENRTRDLQDRTFGLQQTQDAREQGQFEMRMQDWQRQRMAQDAELQASVLHPTLIPSNLTSSIPDAALPQNHPDAAPAIGSGPVSGLQAPSNSATPSLGLVPASAAVTSSAPASGVAREQAKGESRVEVATRTGKANTLSNPDALLASANASLMQANTINQQIHDEFTRSGLDPDSLQGQMYLSALQRHFGAYRDAAFQQALQLRQKADEAKAMHYGLRASNYLLSGKVDQAAPYLQALGSDPALFQGLKRENDFYVLPSGAKFTADSLEALANPSVSQDERMKALAHITDAVMKEHENHSRIQEARVRTAGEHFDPVLARANAMRENDIAYLMAHGRSPQEAKDQADAWYAHNLRGMTGITASEAKTQTAAVGEWKARAQAELAKDKLDASALIAMSRDPVADPDTKAEIRQSLMGMGVNPDAGGGQAGLVSPQKPAKPAPNPKAAALY